MSNIDSISITLTTSSSSSLYASTTANLYSDQLQDPFDDPNGPFANLNLSDDQKKQIEQIFSQNASSGSSSQPRRNSFSKSNRC